MTRKRTGQRYVGKYFRWTLRRRSGVWVADGRGNHTNAGRHSLGTRDSDEARKRLTALDHRIAVQFGLVKPAESQYSPIADLTLEAGRSLYLDHVARPQVTGGVRPSTLKRYRAVFDHFLRYLRNRGIATWNEVSDEVLGHYLGTRAKNEQAAFATQYLEGTTVKQAINYFIKKERLPSDRKLSVRLSKPQGTSTYCYRAEEVNAIIEHCFRTRGIHWLGNVCATMAFTGMRISEVANLRWEDVDLVRGTITLTDESTAGRAPTGRTRRELKTGRNRTLPLHARLMEIINKIPRSDDGFVFHGPRGGRLKSDTVRCVFIRDVLQPLAARFPTQSGARGFTDGRLHSFRHFFCSMCANNNVDLQMLQRWLGHADSKMVAHYYHLHDETAQVQIQRLDFHSSDRQNDGDLL